MIITGLKLNFFFNVSNILIYVISHCFGIDIKQYVLYFFINLYADVTNNLYLYKVGVYQKKIDFLCHFLINYSIHYSVLSRNNLLSFYNHFCHIHIQKYFKYNY